MDVLASASFVLQNEALTQNRLGSDVNALATGLRVRSAVDDPSGYAIAQNLKAKTAGLQQSVTNVQTANNLLSVADGALNSIQLILQRIRSLTVEANSDINSQSDLENIQTEIDSMIQEINKISQETNFNGLSLFNGQFDNGSSYQAPPFIQPQPGQTNFGVLSEVSPILAANGETPQGTVVSETGLSGPGPLITLQNNGIGGPGFYTPAFMVFQVNSSDTPGFVTLNYYAYSQAPSFGTAPLEADSVQVQTNSGQGTFVLTTPSGASPALLLQFTLANVTTADIGATQAFMSLGQPPPATGHSLNVNDGGEEGTTISVNLPQVSAFALNISDISVLDPAVVNGANVSQGVSGSNVIPASDAEIRVDMALQSISAYRAQIGSQMVSTQDDAGNDNTAIVQYQSSSSNITDANIGATATDFTKQQILVSVSTSVLAQLQVSSRDLTALLLNSFSGPVIG
jgi:flagellin